MLEEELLKHCIRRIEKVFNRSDSSLWKNQDFIDLSEKIYAATQISISSDTLKRLFGKKKTYKESISPQPSTKKALAKFLDYPDWDAFRLASEKDQLSTEVIFSKSAQEAFPPTPSSKESDRRNKWLILFGVMLFLLIVSCVFKAFLGRDNGNWSFSASTTKGNVPLGVDFKYDISKSPDGLYTLSFGHPHDLFLSKEYEVVLDKKAQHLFESYRTPGWHMAKFKKDGATLDSVPIYALTNKKWYGMASAVIGHSSLYLPHKEEDGSIFFEPDFMASNGYAKSTNYSTEFRYFDPLPFSGDHCRYFVRLKDDESTGGISCYDVLIFLVGEYGTFRIHFVEPGCQRFSNLIFSDVEISGRKTDLGLFGHLFNEWGEVGLVTSNNTAKVFLNGKERYSVHYNKKVGQVKGMIIRFKGCGKVDYVKLGDDKSKLDFDFNEE